MTGTSLLTGCGTTEKPADQLACGLINPAVVDQIADGRSWTAVGKLYRDGQLRDGCAVLAAGDRLLTITLVDFHDDDTFSASARAQVLEERTALTRSCPQTVPATVTADQATNGCVSEKKVDYAVWNPNRLVRVTLARRFGVVATTDSLARVAASVNANADKIDK